MEYGLIGAGPVHQYLVLKLPRLSRELGRVAGMNPRTSSRIVNTLRAGVASSLEDFQSTRVILICATGDRLPGLLAAVAQKQLDWQGKLLVLCKCEAFSRDLECFRVLGASVASLQAIPGIPHRLVIEGDPDALRVARYLTAQLGTGAIEIDASKSHLYCAALTLASSLFTPLLEGCLTALRRSGLKANAAQFTEAIFLHGLRTFLYSGRKSWSGTVAEGDPRQIGDEFHALAGIQEELAELYRACSVAAQRYLKSPVPPREAPPRKARDSFKNPPPATETA